MVEVESTVNLETNEDYQGIDLCIWCFQWPQTGFLVDSRIEYGAVLSCSQCVEQLSLFFVLLSKGSFLESLGEYRSNRSISYKSECQSNVISSREKSLEG